MNVRTAYTCVVLVRAVRILLVGTAGALIAAPLFALLYGGWGHGTDLAIRTTVAAFGACMILWTAPMLAIGMSLITWRDFYGVAGDKIAWPTFSEAVSSLSVTDLLTPRTLQSVLKQSRQSAEIPSEVERKRTAGFEPQ